MQNHNLDKTCQREILRAGTPLSRVWESFLEEVTLDKDLQEEICRYKQETENPRQWAQCVQRSWGEREHNDFRGWPHATPSSL